MVRATGDGSLFRAYKEVNFLAPIHVGDFMEYRAEVDAVAALLAPLKINLNRSHYMSSSLLR